MRRKVIAVTGGIGSGKSEVMSILRERGYSTVNCDELAREVATYPNVICAVEKLLGSEYVEGRRLDRSAIRQKIFTDDKLLARYNGIFFSEIKTLLEQRLKNETSTVFVEIPVFDAFEFAWDAVWLIDADRETRIERTIRRDNASRDNAEKIIAKQHICSCYTLKIANCGNIDDLRNAVDKALQTL